MRIGPPQTDQERFEAFRCLLGSREDAADQARDALVLTESGEIGLDGLIAAWSDGVPLAAGLFCLGPDGSANVWPPEVRPGCATPQTLATDVLREMAARIDAAGSPLAQSAIDPERHDQRSTLESVGFRKIADLLYLQRPLDRDIPVARPVDSGVADFRDEIASRFAAVISRTYVASADCPAFAACRPADEALRSYRYVGEFTPQRWRLVEQAGDDLGVILVNDRPDTRAREIVYLGVVPEARRQGIARSLIEAALAEAAADGLDAVLTTADAENAAAVSLYRRLGFFDAGTRSVFVRQRAS